MEGSFMNYIFVFIFGIVIGSFLNVCIYRIPKEESISFPPSHCCSCNHRLYPLDLIPVMSYVFLKGRCRYCGEKIPVGYPIIEILNGILYVLIYYKFGFTLYALKYFILVSLLIVISFIDFKNQDVYTSTIIFGVAVGLIFLAIEYILYKQLFLYCILGGILGTLIIGFIVFITRGMGEGDIEIAGVCGLFIGYKLIILDIFLAIVIGGIAALIILGFKIKKPNEKIAFGPCISAGALASILCGNEMVQYYLNLLI